MKFVFTLFFLMLFAVPFELGAQTAVPVKAQKGNRTLISVPVVVSDREGHYIPGLKKDDFTLYQGGVKQNIASFATYDEPINVALVLDTSGSTKDTLKEIKDAAEDFIDLLNPSDKCLIATFDAQVKVLNNLTSDHQTLKNSLAQAQTAQQEGSVVFRAIKQITENSFADVQGRKVVVLLSDGKDFGSTVTKNELLSGLEESDVSIYAIFYQTGAGFNKLVIAPDGTVKEGKESKKPKKEKKPKKKKGYSILIPGRGDVFTQEEVKLSGKVMSIEAVNSLQEISDVTAGRFYQSDAPNLSGIFRRIAGELRQQYRLGYYSTEVASDAAQDIIVKVERPDVVVRARGKFRAKQL